MQRRTAALALCLCCVLATAIPAAAYLPGSVAKGYLDGEALEVHSNVLTSVNTHLPFDYYSLPHCKPKLKTRGEPENLGEILLGDRIKPSPYESILVGENVECAVLCNAAKLTQKDIDLLLRRVKEEYVVNLIADGLPLAVVHDETQMYSVGVPLGVVEAGTSYLYNHLHFHIQYYELSEAEMTKHREIEAKKNAKAGKPTEAQPEVDSDEYVTVKRIISFVAKPFSIYRDPAHPEATCNNNHSNAVLPPHPTSSDSVVWTYGVTWERTESRWATRWDVYLNVADHDIHWFAIVNSVLIVLFLTTMVAVILLRTLKKDITRYNRVSGVAAGTSTVPVDPEDLQEETGWKLVHKDVFRPPGNKTVLAAFAGTGVQLLGMTVSVLVIACLGFLSPANRGALFTALLVLFVFLGIYAGFTSARLLKMWGQANWKSILVTATLVPGVAFGTFFLLNLAVWTTGSSGAVPFPTMLAVIAMWFCISLPLCFVGAVLGYKRDPIKLPVPTNQIPRHLPPTQWHMRPVFTIAIGGILPFGAVFIEIFFILTAVWMNRYYYVFGFLFLVFVITAITCAEIAIVLCYFQLCAEDYRWWWRSFLTSGSTGGYFFLYSVFYFFTSPLQIKSAVPILLYFGYMGLASFIFFVATGTIGLLACFTFVRYMYGSIKVE